MGDETNNAPAPACPECGRHGKSGVGGYCSNHLPPEMHPKYFKQPLGEEDRHVLTSFEQKYNVDRPFFPAKHGIISDKFGIEK